ncbi:MAG: NifB/NifX family molybdenum-iron cluster-binding protein [Calditrichia bacterium]|jgi:predicted Fe-Mo cluster-binding NifX family protein
MKSRIAITVEETLDGMGRVADHFGRCSKFKVYEVNDQKKIVNEEIYQNPLQGSHGGTCQLPHYLNKIGANVVIAGGMGRKAIALFEQYGINIITAPGMNIDEALYGYLNEEISGYQECAGHQGDCH